MYCPRCAGRKNIFKVNGCYSLADTGGVKVTCPMCLGEGKVTRSKVVEASKDKAVKSKRKAKVKEKKELIDD